MQNDEQTRALSEHALLGRDFFSRPAERVARGLVGATLHRITDTSLPPQSFVVTETEAYIGPHDLACHAARGRTKRTEVMYGPPGHLYVYFVYGMHWMLNVVVREVGYPAGVLIRGISGVSGPGRVARHLGLDGTMNGRRAAPEDGLWFTRERSLRRHRITATPRIGIDYAGPVWRERKLRFVLSTHRATE